MEALHRHIRLHLPNDDEWHAWLDREHHELTYKEIAAKRGWPYPACARSRYLRACRRLRTEPIRFVR